MHKRIKEMLERGADSGQIFKDLTSFPQVELTNEDGVTRLYSAQDLTHLTVLDVDGNDISRRPLQGKEFFFMQKLVKVMFERFLVSGILAAENKDDVIRMQGEFGPHYKKIEELKSQMAIAEQYLTRLGIKEFRNNKRLRLMDRLFLLVDKVDKTEESTGEVDQDAHALLDNYGVARYYPTDDDPENLGHVLTLAERLEILSQNGSGNDPTEESPAGHALVEVECVHKCLDERDQSVPRVDEQGKTLSLWGRVEAYGHQKHYEGGVIGRLEVRSQVLRDKVPEDPTELLHTESELTVSQYDAAELEIVKRMLDDEGIPRTTTYGQIERSIPLWGRIGRYKVKPIPGLTTRELLATVIGEDGVTLRDVLYKSVEADYLRGDASLERSEVVEQAVESLMQVIKERGANVKVALSVNDMLSMRANETGSLSLNNVLSLAAKSTDTILPPTELLTLIIKALQHKGVNIA